MIYTDITFHRDVLQGELKGYDFWLRSVAAEPEAGFQNRAWTFWQYTATGHVPGIQGEVVWTETPCMAQNANGKNG